MSSTWIVKRNEDVRLRCRISILANEKWFYKEITQIIFREEGDRKCRPIVFGTFFSFLTSLAMNDDEKKKH